MPTYEHRCKECSHEWEQTYSIHDDPPKVCPECGKENVMRLISGPGKVEVVLQGRELVEKLWKEGKELARKARTDENLAADLYGRK